MTITDLRSALAVLEEHANQLMQTDEPVDPYLELAGVYRAIGRERPRRRPRAPVRPCFSGACAAIRECAW